MMITFFICFSCSRINSGSSRKCSYCGRFLTEGLVALRDFVRGTLRIAGRSTSGGYVCIRFCRLRVAACVVVLLLAVGPVSIAQLIVCPLQIGGGITLRAAGSVGLLDERPGPGQFFGWCGPCVAQPPARRADERGRHAESDRVDIWCSP